MNRFDLSTGTMVEIDDELVCIVGDRDRDKREVVIKISTISSIITHEDYLLIFGLGLPTPKEFTMVNVTKIKQYPNCIVANKEEVKEIAKCLKNKLKTIK